MRALVTVVGAVLVGAVFVATHGQSPRQQVEAKVQEFAHAVGQRQYRTICDDVLAPELSTRLSLYGVPCPRLLRVALGDVHNPIISIGKVTISERRAWVVTLTVAKGERASLATMGLVQTRDGWRISQLASALRSSRVG